MFHCSWLLEDIGATIKGHQWTWFSFSSFSRLTWVNYLRSTSQSCEGLGLWTYQRQKNLPRNRLFKYRNLDTKNTSMEFLPWLLFFLVLVQEKLNRWLDGKFFQFDRVLVRGQTLLSLSGLCGPRSSFPINIDLVLEGAAKYYILGNQEWCWWPRDRCCMLQTASWTVRQHRANFQNYSYFYNRSDQFLATSLGVCFAGESNPCIDWRRAARCCCTSFGEQPQLSCWEGESDDGFVAWMEAS